MASQGPNNPASVVNNDATGNVEWTTPSNAATSNNSYTDTSNGGATGDIVWSTAILLSEGSDVGTDRSDAASLSGSDTYKTFGSSSDKWNWTPTATLINSSTFGVRIQLSDGGNTWGTTYYLEATDFGFTIPASTIDGIVVEIENKQTGGIGYIDHIRITIHYTEAAASGQATRSMHQFRQRRV